MKQIDDSAAEIKAQLSRQKAYQLQGRRVAETAARAEQAEKKAARAETDQEEKGQPYRDDPLFMYLWKRRFLTPDYTGGGLTGSLDGWVAKMINYAEARSNYFMLTELPLRLREHARRQISPAVGMLSDRTFYRRGLDFFLILHIHALVINRPLCFRKDCSNEGSIGTDKALSLVKEFKVFA